MGKDFVCNLFISIRYFRFQLINPSPLIHSCFVSISHLISSHLISSHSYRVSSDWWSYGVVCYHMMTGRHPFYSENKKEAAEKILRKKISLPCPSQSAQDLLSRVSNPLYIYLYLYYPLI